MTTAHVALIVALLLPTIAWAQTPTTRPGDGAPTTRRGRPPQRPIVLGPDDKPAFPPPPPGFDKPRDGIARGKLEMVEYESTTVGTRRKALVYTPPGYAPDKAYNVLYLLHGIGGDETEWRRFCAPDAILDNLYADGKLEPMIVVFPNGRAQPNDRAEGDIFRHMPAFENFTGDLLKDLIPFVEGKYRVRPGREARALGGFSMGGGQTLNIGLRNRDAFAYLGAFSSAPNTRSPDELLSDANARPLKVFYLSCGDKDAFMSRAQDFHAYMKQRDVPHTYHINPNSGHDGECWKIDLYHYAQLLFR